MQEDSFEHERLSKRRAELSQRINELVRICRAASGHIVWIKQEFSPDLSDAMLENRRKGIQIVIAGTPGASILPELDYQSSDSLVIKKRYSAFFGTNLDELLVKLKPSRLVVAGIDTHACVRTTVIDAYQRDYSVILARDCIESHDARHHEVSLEYMDGRLGDCLSNEQIRLIVSGAA